MNKQLKKGIMELIILNLLSDKEYYGYELSQFINEYINFKESSIYIILSRLELNGYVEVQRAKSPINNKTVKYYQINKTGKQYLQEMEVEWTKINELFILTQKKENKE
ncbi:MAG: PadR family transcriptional regulator [Mycoplasmatales bacterium]